MRLWALLGALALCAFGAMPALAEEKTLEERIKQLEKTIQEMKEEEKREREGVPPGVERPEVLRPEAPSAEPGVGSLPEVGRERRAPTQPALSFGSTGSGRLVYAKPFVAAPKAIVGGYMDIQWRGQREGSVENGDGGVSRHLDQHPCAPVHYGDVPAHVNVASVH